MNRGVRAFSDLGLGVGRWGDLVARRKLRSGRMQKNKNKTTTTTTKKKTNKRKEKKETGVYDPRFQLNCSNFRGRFLETCILYKSLFDLQLLTELTRNSFFFRGIIQQFLSVILSILFRMTPLPQPGALDTNEDEAYHSTLFHRAARICLQSPE